jgi:hypothetical protein
MPSKSVIPVLDIGCLECGCASNLLGAYETVEEAQAAHPDAVLCCDARWLGSGLTVIFAGVHEHA